jgi:hypothetical protein
MNLYAFKLMTGYISRGGRLLGVNCASQARRRSSIVIRVGRQVDDGASQRSKSVWFMEHK